MNLSTEKLTDRDGKKTSGFQEDLEHLRQASLFRGLDYEGLKLLAMVCRRITFIAEDQLMVQGEDDGHAFFILSGQVEALYGEDGTSRCIAMFPAGKFVGGCALLGKEPSLFTLQATEETVTLRLGREEFRKTLEQFPRSMAKITGNLVSELVDWDRSLLETQKGEGNTDFSALGVSLL